MRWLSYTLAVVSLMLFGCSEKSETASAPKTNTTANSPLNAPADYLGALGKAQQSAVKTVDVNSLRQAIQLFNADKGRNPKDLNELVQEKYLPALPTAPAGMKIVYDPSSGAVKVVRE